MIKRHAETSDQFVFSSSKSSMMLKALGLIFLVFVRISLIAQNGIAKNKSNRYSKDQNHWRVGFIQRRFKGDLYRDSHRTRR